MTTVKLTDKALAAAIGEGDSLILVQGGIVKRLPLKLLATAKELEAAEQKIQETCSGNIQIMDVGAEDFDFTAMDFSQYAAGDVILVVGDLATS